MDAAVLDGASTAGELYGRALVVLWAAHYARQQVLPRAEQRDRAVAVGELLERLHSARVEGRTDEAGPLGVVPMRP